MSAPARLDAAPRNSSFDGSARDDLWREATVVRREWLDVGLTTEPADRSTAEQALTEIYARHGRPRPSYQWVQSPRAAGPLLTGLPTHQTLRAWVSARRPPGRPPVASDIAAGLSALRSAIAETYEEPLTRRPVLKRDKGKPWPQLSASRALEAGLPFQELLRQGVRDALFRSLSGIYLPVRRATALEAVGWYGNQDAAWVAAADVQFRPGLARQIPGFDAWAALTRSAGWWWPDEHRCILVERPAAIEVDPLPNAWHGEVRFRSIRYRDGWSC